MRFGLGLVGVVLLTSCASVASDDAGPSSSPGDGPVQERLQAIADAVDRWERADDLATAKTGAEAARNLITGPFVRSYGDTDGDGEVAGASGIGLLPGEQGQRGLVTSLASDCVERDVLGGSWDDAAGRWDELRRRIDAWTPTDNTFPALPSHPQRVVGWASLTLDAPTLDLAKEYAGHAQIHVRVSRDAVDRC